MKHTVNYGLLKPERHEYFDIGHLNQNADIYDETMGKFQDDVYALSDEIKNVLENSHTIEEGVERLQELLNEAKELTQSSIQSVNGKSGTDVTLDWSDVEAVPLERKVNGHSLTGDITLSQEDIGIEIDLSEIEEKVEAVLEQTNSASDVIEQAQATADSALETANNAKTAAETAQVTADIARSEAGAAQSTADTANTTANTANITANNAMLKSGGSFTGNVVALNSATTSGMVRNIRVVTSEPTSFTAGEITLLV